MYQIQLQDGFLLTFSYIFFSSFTFPGTPYRIFLLFLPWFFCHFYLVVIEQQQQLMWLVHTKKSCLIKAKSNYIYHFLIDLKPNGITFVQNQSETGKYILTLVWFNQIPKTLLCACILSKKCWWLSQGFLELPKVLFSQTNSSSYLTRRNLITKPLIFVT